MKKIFLEENNGITLVALVVTIIVLLILAGVSLSLVAGSNGILTRANRAVNTTNLAKIKEELELKIAEMQLDYYSESSLQSSYKTANEYVKAELSKEGGIVLPSGVMIKADNEGKLIYGGVEIGTLNPDGTVSIEGEFNGNQVIAKYTVTYNANGLTEATGLPSAQKLENNSKIETSATLTEPHGTPFIGWSTNKNATSAENNLTVNGSNVTLYAVWGELTQSCNAAHPEKHIPTGFSHTEGTVETGYVIKDNEGNEFVWIPVANDAAYAKKMGKNNWYMKDVGSEAGTKFGSVSEAVRGDKLGVTNILGTTVADATTAQQPEYPIVKAAGGFWVGRYEAGIPSVAHSENLVVTKWNSDPGITVKKGNEPVRFIYQSQALSIANNWKNGATNAATGTVAYQSGLITGSQWDAMLNFIGWNIADSDCLGWGNYANVQSVAFTGCTSDHGALNWVQRTNAVKGTSSNAWIFPAGMFKNASNGETVQKNIYDVAGNVWEWTTEIPQYSEANAVLRGGSVWNPSSSDLASFRHGFRSATTDAVYSVGFRIVLYVE